MKGLKFFLEAAGGALYENLPTAVEAQQSLSQLNSLLMLHYTHPGNHFLFFAAFSFHSRKICINPLKY